MCNPLAGWGVPLLWSVVRGVDTQTRKPSFCQTLGTLSFRYHQDALFQGVCKWGCFGGFGGILTHWGGNKGTRLWWWDAAACTGGGRNGEGEDGRRAAEHDTDAGQRENTRAWQEGLETSQSGFNKRAGGGDPDSPLWGGGHPKQWHGQTLNEPSENLLPQNGPEMQFWMALSGQNCQKCKKNTKI